MVVYYENSKGEILNLLKKPYRTVEADWYDSDWDESATGYEKKINIDVFGNRAEFVDNMENLYRIIAVDSEVGVYGRLYVNGSYLRCKILKSKKSSWKGYVFSEVEMIFYAPALEWVEESRKSFFPQQEETSVGGFNYPFNYPFNYTASKRGVSQWEVDYIIPSDFHMIIYGPCVNPRILVNGYPYEVLTSLERNEYLVIDSANSTVTKYSANGITMNLFDNRGYEHSVFEKLPTGLLTFNWSGDFGFDIILYRVRREAKW